MHLPTPLKTRFAPTPSGYLHLGNAFSFILTWLCARLHHGSIHLRIDDIDAQRMRLEYLEDIFESLDWLGLEWDSGATSPDDFLKNYSQTLQLADYTQALALLQQHSLVYPCSCSRKKIKKYTDAHGQYTAHCLYNVPEPSSTALAWRLHIPQEKAQINFYDTAKKDLYEVNLFETMRDFVVWRKDNMPAYQLTSLVDDVRQGINWVVRGEDLLYSTAAQIYMAKQVPAWKSFASTVFLHHSLLKDGEGNKLSKSAGAISLKSWRSEGRKKEELFLAFSKWIGIPPCNTKEQLLQAAKAQKILVVPDNLTQSKK